MAELEVECTRCGRRESFSVQDLIVQYGREKPVSEVLDGLTTACPQREAPTLAQQCDPRSPTLAAMLAPR
jgi:hypothetical protein